MSDAKAQGVRNMFVWEVKFAAGEESTVVNNIYRVTSTTLSGALKKAKRLDDAFVQECFDAGDESQPASVPIGVNIVCRLDDD